MRTWATGGGVRVLLLVAIAAAAAGPLLTIRRVPTPSADGQLYASIARAYQLFGVGVPTVLWTSPAAVDHIPFYGPVFFGIAATFLALFDVTLFTFRLVSVFGAALLVAGAALLTRCLSGERNRALWSALLLLAAPEVNAAATDGAMHILAVGLETLALAAFVRGLVPGEGPIQYGALSGALLTFAALTTPRSYPFILGFVVAGLLPGVFGTSRRAGLRAFAAAVLVLGVSMCAWATWSHGSPARWVRFFLYIFLHEDTDVAVLPTAVREFRFHASALLTPAIAVFGVIAVAVALRKDRDQPAFRSTGAMFAIVTAWIDCVAALVLMNYTFEVSEYFALPLVAVVLAMPFRWMPLRLGTLTAIFVAILSCDAAVLGIRYARIAATWDARDPDPLNAFFRAHVPRGSVVVGPQAPYFFPVERSGSRYRAVLARSWADWARWVPVVEPEASVAARRLMIAPAHSTFFVWPEHESIPGAYDCVRGTLLAVFEPAPTHLDRLGWIGRNADIDRGYPPTALYRLPRGCPAGYDPTIRPER